MILELFLGGVVILFCYLINRRPPNIPPGLWGWPLIGALPSDKITLAQQVKEHSKKYGDIFTWRIGSNINVFLCNYEITKEALAKPELSGRPENYSLDVFANFVKLGLSNSNSEVWQTNRRFALRHLKNMGMGKTSYESVIQSEVSSLVENFKTYFKDSEAKPIPWSLNVAILNVIWRITADRRYEVDDENLQRFNALINDLFSNVCPTVILYDLIPWLHKVVPKCLDKWTGVDKFLAIYDEIKDYLMKTIDEHQQTLDVENPRDYTDHYLIEMESQKHNSESHLSRFDLMVNLADIFIAGSETTSSSIRWTIFYLAKYPEIQKKVQREIDSVVDRHTLPSLEHRNSLPYFEAVCREIMRFVSLTPIALPHCALQETTLGGFTIPKGAVIMPSLEQVHFDPKYWEKPDEIYPEHFLDKEGKLLSKNEAFIPFSIGKRICPGESLARMELYLFLSALLQNFDFELPEGQDLNPKRSPLDRIINTCKPYMVIARNRK